MKQYHWTDKDTEYLKGAFESLRLEINKLWITKRALQAEIEKVSDEIDAIDLELKKAEK